MEKIQKHLLERLRRIKRSKHHPLLHKLHKRYKISRRTLFYVKEYGPHSNVPHTIIKESVKILLLASLVSAFGGFALEQIRAIFISIAPLIILLPALNDMIGDFGTIISSRFATMLHEGKARGNLWVNGELKKLFAQIMLIALLMALIAASFAVFARGIPSFPIFVVPAMKIFFITITDALLLVITLFLTTILAGLYFFSKGEDPNNFLIPITTSIADFANMFLLAGLVILVF